MWKSIVALVFTCFFVFQISPANANCLDDLCGRWVGQTTVANNEDPLLPFVEVDMVIEITDIEATSKYGRLFVGTIEFLGMSGPPTPFDLTGVFFGRWMKASTAGTVVNATVKKDGTRMTGYYLDTLLIPGTRAHPQTGKFVLEKAAE